MQVLISTLNFLAFGSVLYGIYLCVAYVAEAGGWVLAVLSVLFLPFTYFIAPIVAGLAAKNWDPMLFCFGVPFAIGLLVNMLRY